MSNAAANIAAAPVQNRRIRTSPDRVPHVAAIIIRICLALILTIGLLVFLALTRLNFASDTPTLTIRSIDRATPVSLPAPPPPSAEKTPPPPPPPIDLPKLKLEMDPVAPPIHAATDVPLDVPPTLAEFAPVNEAPREAMMFTGNELDSAPKLLNSPIAKFPEALKEQGVYRGLVRIAVAISPSGRVKARHVVSATHPELIPEAKKIVERARFTAPTKDGRTVHAEYVWPIQITR